ncbi:MAG: xylulokinase [Chloroflexi bacterium]|nr:xylulokinase [Chloroflexota bacterium]
MPELILAHDLGTTGNKASLFGPEGDPVASAYAPYPTAYSRPGWAEQDPGDWWGAVVRSTQELLGGSRYGPDDVAVVAFSGQMMACLPVDAEGAPLRSAIIWADQRAEAQADVLAERVGRRRVYEITGHRAGASYTAAKAMWLRDEQPEVYRRTHRLLQPKDYVAYRLTGEIATDFSDASGTNLFDLRARTWSGDILQAIDLDPALLPPAQPSATVIGSVTASAAAETGLRPGTPVVIGGGDGACATAGAGVVGPGDAYAYLGASSWIANISREPLYDPAQRTFTFAHLDPDYLFPTGTMQCAGGSFDWLERLYRGGGEGALYDEMEEQAAGAAAGAGGLLFLPYLIGERSPHWNPHARGAFVGLTMTHGRAEMARAVLEGVAFNLRIILDAFREQGAPIAALRLIGGGARSDAWRQILADILNVPLLRTGLIVEATALGAAIAGGVGVGLYPGYEVAAELAPAYPGEEPDPAHAGRYEEQYGVFREAYEALVPIYERMAAPRQTGGTQ